MLQHNQYKLLSISRISFVATIIMLVSTNVLAQYKWVDKKGIVVYSDSPPQSAQARNIKVTTFVKTKNKLLPVAQAPTKPVQGEEALNQTPEVKKSFLYDKEACSQMEGYLRILQEGGRIIKPQPNGERMVLDDKAKEKEMQELQNKISNSCKKN